MTITISEHNQPLLYNLTHAPSPAPPPLLLQPLHLHHSYALLPAAPSPLYHPLHRYQSQCTIHHHHLCTAPGVLLCITGMHHPFRPPIQQLPSSTPCSTPPGTSFQHLFTLLTLHHSPYFPLHPLASLPCNALHHLTSYLCHTLCTTHPLPCLLPRVVGPVVAHTASVVFAHH